MSRCYLIARLAARDLRHRPGEAAMLVMVMVAATAALALGLVLHGVTSHPYQVTRAQTHGPDLIATYFPSGRGTPANAGALREVASLARARGVTASSGPFPVAFPVLRARGGADAVLAEGRAAGPAAVDQPKVTAGTWVRPGGVVVERSFAIALGLRPGDHVTLDGRRFTVDGVAVTAAFPVNGVGFLEGSTRWPNPGLVWTTKKTAEALRSRQHPLGYVLNLELARRSAAIAVADRYDQGSYTNNNGGLYVIPWQLISQQDGQLVTHEKKILLVASWLLALLAIASLATLVGGRMAGQRRRVGLLKAIGSTPEIVAGVLIAEYLVLAVVAAAIGLAIGRAAAPQFTSPGSGLLGSAGPPEVTGPTVAVVLAAAIAVAALATLVPALRAARTSTVSALADTAQTPRRARLLAWSTRLPVTIQLAAWLAARRPRRVALATVSITVTVSGIVAVLFAHATLAVSQLGTATGSPDPGQLDVGFIAQSARENRLLLLVTVMLGALAGVNAIFITRATVRDGWHTSAVSRALGATPEQVTAALSMCQVGPAFAGSLLGIAGGLGFFTLASQGGAVSAPPAWWLVAAVLATVALITVLTAVPARLAVRVPVAQQLQAGQ